MTLLIFILVLSILVLVHEFGHFIVAKLSGVRVEEFGLGLPIPPRLICIRRGETRYCLYPLLFGGFVRLYGEESKVEKDVNRAFSSKSKKIKAAIITAGVIMNFLLAVFAFSILYSVVGVPGGPVKVTGTTENSPAKMAGFLVGDTILSVDGTAVHSNEKFIQLIENRKGREITVELMKKNGEEKLVNLTPREKPPAGEGPLGVAISDFYFPPIWQRPIIGVWYGVQEAVGWGLVILQSIATVFKTLFTTATLPRDLAGPVGIFQITGGVAQQGFLAILQFLGILSVNLAILNVVPFPALDGGRLLFVVLDGILGKRAKDLLPKVEQKANMVGFALLIAFLVAITLQDVKRLIGQ